MNIVIILAAAAALPSPAAGETDAIIVTGARDPVAAEQAAVSATVFDAGELEALGLSAAADVLRLAPGVSVATTGPRGTQAQLRIRGAEANHTLLFVDGIRFNDPAAGNEARFELLGADTLSRIEIVRGPQSALWGSEALGGVVAVETADARRARGLAALAEFGSLDSRRASVEGAVEIGDAGLSGGASWLRSDGIDSFGGRGERDGFETRTATLKGVLTPLPSLELGLVGHWIDGESQFDGLDPVSFRRADTLDATANRIAAARGWARLGDADDWSLLVDASLLDSANRNRLADTPLNRTDGRRTTAGAQLSKRIGDHRLTAAVEHEDEDFRARDQAFFGGTDQDRSRRLTALVGEWRAEWSPAFATDLAVRHDSFSAFADATSLRASALVRPAADWTLHAAYGEGIAQPTFYDLFGFFPGSFEGNPALRPESSRGWEAGARWSRGRFSAGVTGFSHRLRDEIVDIFDPVTFLASAANAEGTSRRHGIEAEAEFRPTPAWRLAANYTWLDADERTVAGAAAVREIRRPRHSANLLVDGRIGPVTIGGSLAHVGKRRDTDFDPRPAETVTLDDYWLGSLRVAWQLSPAVEAYARAENLFDADYQDVVGYETPGRTFYAGLRLRLGR
jgi:vitamin B12 transporter